MKQRLWLPIIAVMFLCNALVAQRGLIGQLQPPDVSRSFSLSCTETLNFPNCNNILNPEFNHNATASGFSTYSAFNDGNVYNWSNSHGTPHLTTTGSILWDAPSGISNTAAFMFAEWYDQGEGMYARLSPLIQGENYVFSFFAKNYNFLSGNPFGGALSNKYEVILFKCPQAQTYFHNGSPLYVIPNIPINSQTIYCRTNMNTFNWEQQVVSFTANSNYNAIWIRPKMNNATTGHHTIGFAYPELMPASKLSILNTSSNGCTKTYATECKYKNAQFSWYLNGNLYSNNETVTLNTQTDYGTLSLSISNNASLSSNTCSNNSPVFNSSITIMQCNIDCFTNIPQITADRPLDRCYIYDGSDFIRLSTNLTSNIQWYKNGLPIPPNPGSPNDGNAPTYREDNNPGPSWPTSVGTYYVKNTLNGCTSSTITVTRRNYSTPDVNPNGFYTPINYCKNTLGNLNQFQSLTDPNTVYSWSVLDPSNVDVTNTLVTLGSNFSSNFQTTISFVNYPHTTAKIIATTTDNGCTNSRIPYEVTINSGCKTVNIGQSNSFKSQKIFEGYGNERISISPNPASTTISVQATTSNSLISIYTLNNKIVKTIRNSGKGNIQIDISDLEKGMYILKVQNSNSVQSLKFCKLL